MFECRDRLLGQISNVLLVLGITAAMAVVTAAVTYFVDVLSLIGSEAAANPFNVINQQQTAIAGRQD